ncbi:MAG: class I SAM-dependent methyltransferase [Acidobacteriaceae bacterium]|nr:class I SAM-dependent methyltransferase [Acidobacteriaceae bacterium]
METGSLDSHVKENILRAEFDLLADEYHDLHKVNVAITGEGPEYFAEYKIADLSMLARKKGFAVDRILDFGSGIGNSIPHFRKYFSGSKITCADVSARSIDISQRRFVGDESYLLLDEEIPLASHSQDIVFSACVFHHIPHKQHQHWLTELRRITRPNGLLAIYEHNPLNPLTLHAVNTCPLDVNARLIRGGIMRHRATTSGWGHARVDYRLFFPAILRPLRPLEQHLGWLCFGAQYRMTARSPV